MSRDLIEAAKAARQKAHAPYSRFLVGAAVRDEQGRVFGGCNIENAAYPQGWCAEPSAISAMIIPQTIPLPNPSHKLAMGTESGNAVMKY